MVGLLVTPTTCFSRRSASNPPVASRCREMSSSHTATPAADSSASLSVIAFPLLVARGGTGDRADPGERRAGRRHRMVRREAELLEQHLVRRARAVVLDAHRLAEVADQVAPGHRDARLDADPCLDPGRQHLLPVCLVLRVEPFTARHRHDPRRGTVGLQPLLPGTRNVPPCGGGPPWSAIPWRIAPMPCSRMPKCRVRPSQSPGKDVVEYSGGTNDGSPSIVVLLLSARSAEPPHSSGSAGAIALITSPDAFRVAIPLLSALNAGSASIHPPGRVREASRSNSARRSALAPPHASNARFHSSCAARPRSITLRVCASTSSATAKDFSGSKPSSFLVVATSSAPSAEPCALPVFCLLGAGQPMMVRRLMNDGRPVSAFAARIAA